MRILLDTCSLNTFRVTKNKKELTSLNTLLKSKSAQLCFLHVTAGERFKGILNYNKIIKKLEKQYTQNGLEIHVNMSEIFVPDITIKGTAKIANAFQITLYDELLDLVNKCENYEKPCENLKRDAIIGVTSLKYDIFITSDKCLEESLNSVIKKNESKIKNIPVIAYRKPEYKEILDEIKLQLENWTGGEGAERRPTTTTKKEL